MGTSFTEMTVRTYLHVGSKGFFIGKPRSNLKQARYVSSSGRSCKYAGRDGRYPSATVCKQMYSLQNMLAINEEGTVYVETFRIPSACVCELINKDPFQR